MLNNIKLHNFKCFEDVDLDLAPFTLLAGLNGMGKSTVIQALLLLRQNYELGILKRNQRVSLNGDLVQIGNARDLLFQYFKSYDVSIEFNTTDTKSVSWQLDASIDTDYLPLKKTPRLTHNIYKSALFRNHFHYFSAERLGPRVYFETSNYDVINKNQIGVHGEFAANYLAEYQRQEIHIKQLQHPKTEGFSLYEQTNAWLGEIRPNTRINVTSNLDLGLVGLSYQFLGGLDVSNKFRPTNVGFGLSYVLPLIVAVLSSKPGSLLIVENPEAHLHPQGQSRVGTLLATAAANGIQVMVETHSEHILNGARIAIKDSILDPTQTKLLFFTGEVAEDQFKHYILSPHITKDGKLEYWPDGFLDQADKDLDRLFDI